MAAPPEQYQRQLRRMAEESRREAQARAKAHDMHGGDTPAPTEPPPPTIIAQFGEWAVTPFGVECLVYPYQIQWDSLLDDKVNDEFWLRNLAGKPWVNLDDFADALRHGRQIHRYLRHEG